MGQVGGQVEMCGGGSASEQMKRLEGAVQESNFCTRLYLNRSIRVLLD